MAKVQPKSPQDEGVDPLTKGETLYPREDTKAESEKLAESKPKILKRRSHRLPNLKPASASELDSRFLYQPFDT